MSYGTYALTLYWDANCDGFGLNIARKLKASAFLEHMTLLG